jgi:DNA replication protein DnaD
MSFQAMTWAVKQPLPAYEKLTLLILANYTDSKHQCFPSAKRLSEDTGMSISQVRKCILTLIKRGAVKKRIRVTKHGHSSNLYTLNVEIHVGSALKPIDDDDIEF